MLERLIAGLLEIEPQRKVGWKNRPKSEECRSSDGSVRMAFLSVVGSHSVNGVAALHTKLLKENFYLILQNFTLLVSTIKQLGLLQGDG